MRKQITSVLLILSLIMPVIIQIGLLLHHKIDLNESFKEAIDNDELVYFNFTNDELNQLDWKHSKEFKYQGNMYDIVHSEQKGDQHIFWCYKDDFEREIKKKINQFLAFGMDDDMQKKDHQKKLTHFFNTLYFQEIEFPLNYFSSFNKTDFPNSFNTLKTDLSSPFPPPKNS